MGELLTSPLSLEYRMLSILYFDSLPNLCCSLRRPLDLLENACPSIGCSYVFLKFENILGIRSTEQILEASIWILSHKLSQQKLQKFSKLVAPSSQHLKILNSPGSVNSLSNLYSPSLKNDYWGKYYESIYFLLDVHNQQNQMTSEILNTSDEYLVSLIS